MMTGCGNHREVKVAILLSTYNGELYLREQLDSILNQTHQNIDLLVRDDGSTDGTLAILEEYTNICPKIHYYQGENIGPARSFLDLLKNASEADYYALSDQDDVWLPEKIEIAIGMLVKEQADFYYSGTRPVDVNLKLIDSPPIIPVKTFGASLVFASVTGCTVVFSKRLIEIYMLYSPAKLLMHDSWLFKIALATGHKVAFDDNPYILYRQHENNVVGSKQSILRKWNDQIRRLRYHSKVRYEEVEELYKGYGHTMRADALSVVKPLIGYKDRSFLNRLTIAIKPCYRCGVLSKDILFVLSILTKSY